jgi:hypothetical protein
MFPTQSLGLVALLSSLLVQALLSVGGILLLAVTGT